MKKIYPIIEAGTVARYHTRAGIPPQSTAEHSWGVALMLYRVCEYFETHVTQEMMLYALVHDLPERQTGDIPAPMKWDNPEIRHAIDITESAWYGRNDMSFDKLNREQKQLVKYADWLEAICYLARQVSYGNMACRGMLNTYLKSCEKEDVLLGQLAHEVMDEINEFNPVRADLGENQ